MPLEMYTRAESMPMTDRTVTQKSSYGETYLSPLILVLYEQLWYIPRERHEQRAKATVVVRAERGKLPISAGMTRSECKPGAGGHYIHGLAAAFILLTQIQSISLIYNTRSPALTLASCSCLLPNIAPVGLAAYRFKRPCPRY